MIRHQNWTQLTRKPQSQCVTICAQMQGSWLFSLILRSFSCTPPSHNYSRMWFNIENQPNVLENLSLIVIFIYSRNYRRIPFFLRSYFVGWNCFYSVKRICKNSKSRRSTYYLHSLRKIHNSDWFCFAILKQMSIESLGQWPARCVFQTLEGQRSVGYKIHL